MDTNHHETEWAGGPSRSILIGVNSCHFVAILCLLLAVLAEAGEIEYHPTLDAAIEAATKSHQLVMVIIVAPGTDKAGRDVCKLFREETLPDEEIAKLIKAHFAPFLVDTAEVRAGKQAIPPAVQACFKPNEQIGFPVCLFVDAKCKEVDRIAGYAPAMQYIGQLKRVVAKAIAQVPDKDRRDAQRAFERGKEAIERKDLAAAVTDLKAAIVAGLFGADAAKRMLEDIEAKANEKYQEGVALEGKEKLGSAVRAYRECAREFKGTESADNAAKRIAEIRNDPDIRKRLNAYMAGKLLAAAQEAVSQKRYAAAVASLDTIAKRYGDTEQAAEAKELRDKLAADPNVAAGLKEAGVRGEAERYLSLGDTYRRNKMLDKARAEYQKVVAKYPDTSFAQTAKERIAEIDRERGTSR